MAINYDFYKTAGHYANEEKPWHVRPVENGTIETDLIMQRIEQATTLTMPDLKGALDAFVTHIGNNLAEGKGVHVKGLGHFSISIGGEVVLNEEGKPRLRHPAVRSVKFRPEPALLRRLSHVSFTSQEHRGRKSASVDEAELPAILKQLCAGTGFFTTRDFQEKLRLTASTTIRRLQGLRAGGVIENIGSRRYPLYRLCEKG